MRTGSRTSCLTLALGIVAALPAGAIMARAQDSSSTSPQCDTCMTGHLQDLQRQMDQLHQELARARRAYDSAMSPRMQREMARTMSSMQAQLAAHTSGWLGITVSGQYTVESDNGRQIMRFEDYPTIETVEPDSPAERAGIEARDQLIALGGRDVTQGALPFSKLLKPGAKLTVRVKRGRSTKDFTAIVGKRPQDDWPVWNFSYQATPQPAPRAMEPPRTPGVTVSVAPLPPMPAMGMPDQSRMPMELHGPESAAIAGARVQRVLGDLKDYFGVKDGLLILDVVRGTPAQRAGLRGGDVIVGADGQRITSPMSLARAMERNDSGEMKLEVVRKKQTRTVVLRWGP
jgi:C-terminal processing protease CtpA/Prc